METQLNVEEAFKTTPSVPQSVGEKDSLDPFSDLSKLRVSQNFMDTAGVKKVSTKVIVRKPGKQEFVRVAEDPKLWFAANLLVIQEDRDVYLITPELATQIEGDIQPHYLVPTISRQGNVFLWPIPLSGPDSIASNWHCSALEAAKLAREKWTRVYFKSLAAGQYEVLTAKAEFPPPEWPEHTLQDYLRLAFRDRVISSIDHKAIRRLRGEE